jgi:serine/threonine protein kinase
MLIPNTILQGRYRIVRQLGQGGMGTVYEAIDDRFESQVALKETLFTDDALRRQFEREARLLNKLRHPAMTRVVDHFIEGNGQYLVMDFVPGEDLAGLLKRKGEPFPVANVIEWGEQLLDALNYLHSQQPPIIHRDIKPQNLKLTDQGRVILLDFGLAKGSIGQMTTVATSHSVLGYSLAYAPLEQMLKVEQHWIDMLSVNHADQVAAIQKMGTDARSDLYSLAATLLHLLVNKVPPNAPTRALSVWSGRPDPIEALFDRNVPPAVAHVLRRAMALALNDRFSSAAEMQRALEEAGSTQASETKPAAEQAGTTIPVSPHVSGYAPTVVTGGPSPTEIPTQTQPQQPHGLAPTLVVKQQPWEPQQQQPWEQRQAFSNYSPTRKNYLPWIIGGGVVLVAVVVVVIILATTSSKQSLSTPTDAAKAFIDAIKRKDAAAYKRAISQRFLAQLDQRAEQLNTSTDNLIQQGLAQINLVGDVEFSNEQINGEFATVNMKFTNNYATQVELVKEGGEWKVNSPPG